MLNNCFASGSYTYLPMKKGIFFYDIFGGDIYREHFDTYDEAKEYLKLQEKINKMQGKEIMNVKFEE